MDFDNCGSAVWEALILLDCLPSPNILCDEPDASRDSPIFTHGQEVRLHDRRHWTSHYPE